METLPKIKVTVRKLSDQLKLEKANYGKSDNCGDGGSGGGGKSGGSSGGK